MLELTITIQSYNLHGGYQLDYFSDIETCIIKKILWIKYLVF